nr:MAG TPA: hypothetical protein [Caudoviricetes sp.]
MLTCRLLSVVFQDEGNKRCVICIEDSIAWDHEKKIRFFCH